MTRLYLLDESEYLLTGSVLKVEMTAEVRGLTACITEAYGLSCAAHLRIWHTTLEAFRDRAAGEAHVHSEHFQAAMAWMPEAISETPEIIHVEVPGDNWSTMAELQPRTTP